MTRFRSLLSLSFAVVFAAGCGQSGSDNAQGPAAGSGAEALAKAAMENVITGPTELGKVPVSPTDETPVPGDWLIDHLNSEPPHLNVLHDASDAYANQLTRFTFESLIERDPATLEDLPSLATRWEISEDKLTYTFYMDERARFSDGKPVTAHDVKFTYDAIKNPANETADVRNYYESVINAEVVDDLTIRFTCDKPYFKHLDMIGGMPIFPKHVYSEGDFNTHPNNRHPIGSGPYVFESWTTNQQIVFARNPNYWRPDKAGHIEKLVTKVISEDNTAHQALVRRDIDYLEYLPEIWVNQTAKPEFQAAFNRVAQEGRSGYVGGYTYLAWNTRLPQFADKRVRQALTMLLPREDIVREIFYGLGRVHTGPSAYMEPSYDKTIEPWPFDPERAIAQLDEAGWADTNGNGVRDKDGVELEFEYIIPNIIPEYEQIATLFKEQLDAAGVSMQIRPLEWATLIDNLQKRSFGAVSLAWAVPTNQDPYQVWHSSMAEQGSNYPGFKSAEVDAILEAARLEFDKDKRNEMYRRLHAIIHEEQPYTFLLSRPRLIAFDKRFQNVNIYSVGMYPIEWWVKADMKRY